MIEDDRLPSADDVPFLEEYVPSNKRGNTKRKWRTRIGANDYYPRVITMAKSTGNRPKSYDAVAAELIRQQLIALTDKLGSQQRVADVLGVNQSTINKNVNGKTAHPSLRLLLGLSRILEMSIDDILGISRVDRSKATGAAALAAAELDALRDRIEELERARSGPASSRSPKKRSVR